MDVVLRLCMEEWAAESYKRGQNLASLFFTGDVDSNGVLSLDEFLAVIRHARPHGFEAEAVRMFREACVLTEDRNRRKRFGALSLGELATWGVGVDAVACVCIRWVVCAAANARWIDS